MVSCRWCCWFKLLFGLFFFFYNLFLFFTFFPELDLDCTMLLLQPHFLVPVYFVCLPIFCSRSECFEMMLAVPRKLEEPEGFTCGSCCWFIGNCCWRALFRHKNNIRLRVCLDILKPWPWNSLGFHCSWAGRGSKFEMKLFFHIHESWKPGA